MAVNEDQMVSRNEYIDSDERPRSSRVAAGVADVFLASRG
jgi:hypothetical protein